LETIGEKNLQLLKEISSGIERFGIMHSPENVSSLASFKVDLEQTAPRLGLVAGPVPGSKPAGRDEGLANLVRERGQALQGPPTSSDRCAAGKNRGLRHRATSADCLPAQRHGPRRASHVIWLRQ